MRKPFLIGFIVAMLLTVAFLIIKGKLSEPANSPTPSLGPSLLSTTPEKSGILPPLGGDDRIVAKGNIEKILAIGSDTIEPLKELCRSTKMLERLDALVALYRVSSRDAAPQALRMLSDSEPEVLVAAMTVCAKTKTLNAAGRIIELMSSPDAMVRARAVKAISYLKEKDALDLAVSMLRDKAAIVRDAASASIEAITYETFGLIHSGYQSQQDQALKALTNWIAGNRRYSRFEWLERKVISSLNGLENDDPWIRHDSNVFLVKIFGETNFYWDMPAPERTAIAEMLKKKWKEYTPLFSVTLPCHLDMEIQ